MEQCSSARRLPPALYNSCRRDAAIRRLTPVFPGNPRNAPYCRPQLSLHLGPQCCPCLGQRCIPGGHTCPGFSGTARGPTCMKGHSVQGSSALKANVPGGPGSNPQEQVLHF